MSETHILPDEAQMPRDLDGLLALLPEIPVFGSSVYDNLSFSKAMIRHYDDQALATTIQALQTDSIEARRFLSKERATTIEIIKFLLKDQESKSGEVAEQIAAKVNQKIGERIAKKVAQKAEEQFIELAAEQIANKIVESQGL